MEANAQGPPTPDPALRALEPFSGTWEMKGHLIGSDEENIVGRVSYEWLPGGFFLQQDIDLDFAGMFHVQARELIGYDAGSGTFPSTVFSSLSPEPLPYTWEVDGRKVKITVSHGPLDSTFNGEFSEDGTTFSGGWRANPGADETVNIPYDVSGRRVS